MIELMLSKVWDWIHKVERGNFSLIQKGTFQFRLSLLIKPAQTATI
jgi:hypothetical protein